MKNVNSARVLVSGLLVATLLLACNRHTTTSSVDSFDGPVRGDTVAYYPTMNVQLREDSLEQNESYFYRINRVKRVEIIDGNSREINEIDRFGHMLVEEHSIDGELFWRNVDVYNRYGHKSSDEHIFYDDGTKEDLVFKSTYKYEPDGWRPGEHLLSIEMKSWDADDGERTTYSYVYHYSGHLVDYETRFENKKCTEKVITTYTDFEKPLTETTINYEENIPDTTVCTYKYDAQHRLISSSVTRSSVLIEDRVIDYNAAGRPSKYTSTTYERYSQWIFETFYLKNGLVEKRILTHDGVADTEIYRYAFY